MAYKERFNLNLNPDQDDEDFIVDFGEVIYVTPSTNYNELFNKPSINGVILQGDKTSAQLNIIVPTKTSDLTNDNGFITNSVDNLVNYYTKTEVDTLGGELTQTLETYVNTELSDYTKTSDLATVALSGRYNDLINKPDLTNYLETTDVINNVTSSDTDKPLSANMGKELNDRIQNLASIGKYLAMWDCTTGLPTTDPVTMPYTYTTGDYYVISNIGATNYMPNGSTYTGAASITQYTGTLNIGDFFYYDGTVWTLLENTGKTVYFANIAGDPMDNSNLASALNSKQDEIDSSHKLNSDLVSDTNQTNKFVTTSEKSTWNGKYDKPSGGIPSTDLSSAVQTSLGKADTAIQDISTLVPKTTTIAGVDLQDNITKSEMQTALGVSDMVTLTQAQYDALISGGTVDPNTYYFIEEG